jgi:hypothetical protein
VTPDEMRAEAARLEALATERETQLSRDDVTRMYSERRYDEIEEARQQGRLADLLGTHPTTEGARP